MSPVEVRSAESAPLDVVRKEEKAVSDEIQFKYFYGTESEMLPSIGFRSSWSQASILRR